MSGADASLIQVLAIAGIVVGLAGLVLPVIPGPAVIWVSCVAWAWADGFDKLGWPALGFLTILAVIAQGADLIIGALGMRQAGVPAKTMFLAGLAGIVGFVVLNFVGAIIGAVIALIAVETRRLGGDWQAALKSGGTMVAAYIVAMALEIVLSLSMVAFFIAQVISD